MAVEKGGPKQGFGATWQEKMNDVSHRIDNWFQGKVAGNPLISWG